MRLMAAVDFFFFCLYRWDFRGVLFELCLLEVWDTVNFADAVTMYESCPHICIFIYLGMFTLIEDHTNSQPRRNHRGSLRIDQTRARTIVKHHSTRQTPQRISNQPQNHRLSCLPHIQLRIRAHNTHTRKTPTRPHHTRLRRQRTPPTRTHINRQPQRRIHPTQNISETRTGST